MNWESVSIHVESSINDKAVRKARNEPSDVAKGFQKMDLKTIL